VVNRLAYLRQRTRWRATWKNSEARLIDAWPTLPDAIRADILAMVEAARK
jgi:hypothetical protein